ncbi:uncharacterized protein LOC130713886 [Lotus japonicus]|uniref:uncharacterized protein LOC130713886 n=1 Tax=Lotus japonicus TaxID=34305 RepID=UPI002582D2F0|nr:uncharacterized protein LOC130713886 [Lotus japonicus]
MSFPLPNRGSPLAYCKRTFTVLRMWLQTTPTGCEGSRLQNKTHGKRGVSMISTHKIPYHIDLLLGFASLRSTSFNSFAFPVGMMPSTLLDVMNALGLLSSSEELFLFTHTFSSKLRNLDIHSDKQEGGGACLSAAISYQNVFFTREGKACLAQLTLAIKDFASGAVSHEIT